MSLDQHVIKDDVMTAGRSLILYIYCMRVMRGETSEEDSTAGDGVETSLAGMIMHGIPKRTASAIMRSATQQTKRKAVFLNAERSVGVSIYY